MTFRNIMVTDAVELLKDLSRVTTSKVNVLNLSRSSDTKGINNPKESTRKYSAPGGLTT